MVTHVVNWLLDSMAVVHYQRLVYIAFYIVQISSSLRTVEYRERWKVITGSIFMPPSWKKLTGHIDFGLSVCVAVLHAF